jgi:TRAP-type C4-dicarboxylate transport system substrate-binding protein
MTATTALLVMAVTTQAGLAKTLLRANSQWTEVHAGSKVDMWWADEIKKRTNGEVEIKLFFGGALGKAQENLPLLQEGAIDIAMMSPGYFPAQLPFHAAPNSIPMAMSKVDEATELMERLMAEVQAFDDEARDNGVKTLFFHHLNPYKLVCKEHITGVADMQGKKMRTWGKDLPRAVETVGATPVTLFFPDIYEALARNTVDCIPVSVDLFLNYKFYEVAKHVHDVTIWEGPTAGTWITLSAWDKLSAEQQKIVQEVSLEAMSRDRDMTVAAGEAAIAELKGHGVQFHDFPAADAAKWRELNPDFFGDFIKDMDAKGKGDAARKMIEIWKEVTGKM